MKYYYLFNGYLVQLFKTLVVTSALVLSALVVAQSESNEAEKIAVVDVQLAVLQTEQAQAQLAELKEQDDFKKNLKGNWIFGDSQPSSQKHPPHAKERK